MAWQFPDCVSNGLTKIGNCSSRRIPDVVSPLELDLDLLEGGVKKRQKNCAAVSLFLPLLFYHPLFFSFFLSSATFSNFIFHVPQRDDERR